MSQVYFAPARAKRWDYSASQVAGLERLIENARKHNQGLKVYDMKKHGALIAGTEPMNPSNESMRIMLLKYPKHKVKKPKGAIPLGVR